MFGHDDVSKNDKAVTFSGLFKDAGKPVASVRRTEPRLSAITAAGDEVEISGTVISFEPCGHW